jgi:hypothetical protein
MPRSNDLAVLGGHGHLKAVGNPRGILDFANGYLEVFDFIELERICSPRNWT